MVPGLVSTMPYGKTVGDPMALHPGRKMANWGSPLPTRKLAPHDDVCFDLSLKPREHRMVGKKHGALSDFAGADAI